MASGMSSMDWSLCIFCQMDTTEKLINPTEESYSSTERHLEGFKTAGVFLSSLNTDKFNDGSGIASTSAKHGAKWHKNCRAKYNQRMLNRAEKRQHDETEKDENFYLKVYPVTKPHKDAEIPPAVPPLLPDATLEGSAIQQESE
ncbi:hypothetical protein ACOMHN_052764 [Nucella lapillus]